MKKNNKIIITMDSIHYILKAEKILKSQKLDIELIPVPKEINSNCGNAIEIRDENIIDKVINILNKKNFKFKIFKFDDSLNFYLEIGGKNDR